MVAPHQAFPWPGEAKDDDHGHRSRRSGWGERLRAAAPVLAVLAIWALVSSRWNHR